METACALVGMLLGILSVATQVARTLEKKTAEKIIESVSVAIAIISLLLLVPVCIALAV